MEVARFLEAISHAAAQAAEDLAEDIRLGVRLHDRLEDFEGEVKTVSEPMRKHIESVLTGILAKVRLHEALTGELFQEWG